VHPWRGTTPAPPMPRRRLRSGQWLVVAGTALAIGGLGLAGPMGSMGPHLGFVVPVVAVTAGAFLAWSQLDDAERGRWGGRSRRGKAFAVARPLVGVTLAAGGVIALTTMGQGLSSFWNSAVASFAVLLGAMVIAAPWVVRLWQGLQHEQTERIRATERADIAAHLHDSVLQTLAHPAPGRGPGPRPAPSPLPGA